MKKTLVRSTFSSCDGERLADCALSQTQCIESVCLTQSWLVQQFYPGTSESLAGILNKNPYTFSPYPSASSSLLSLTCSSLPRVWEFWPNNWVILFCVGNITSKVWGREGELVMNWVVSWQLSWGSVRVGLGQSWYLPGKEAVPKFCKSL